MSLSQSLGCTTLIWGFSCFLSGTYISASPETRNMGPIFKIHPLFSFYKFTLITPLISCWLLVPWYSIVATSSGPQRSFILFLKWRMTKNPSPFSIFANRFKNQGVHLTCGIIRYQVFFSLNYWNDVKMKRKQIWVDFLSVGSKQSPWGVLIIAWPFWMCIFPFLKFSEY